MIDGLSHETLLDVILPLASLDTQVSASSDHTIRVWGPNWTCDKVLQCSGVWSLNVFNERLVSGSLDNAVKVWGV